MGDEMSALLWDNGKPRSRGGPFDILYVPRKEPVALPPEVQKKKAAKAKDILTRDNAGYKFCIAIPNQADADKQKRIKKGRAV